MVAWREALTGRGHGPAGPARHPPDAGAVAELALRHATALGHYRGGRFETAVPLFEQILLGCRAVLGDRHAATLTVEGNLAVAHLRARRTAEGLAGLAVISDLRRHTFGEDDPRTLTALDCLATAYRMHGRAAEAVPLAEAVAAARERVLGATHPDTLTSRLGLALAHLEVDDVRKARVVLVPAVDDAERTHGPAHPHTIALRATLACCHALTGQLTAAAGEYAHAVL